MVKKGDTLIEVTLAVGIFSMVAVAVVAVMSNGTAGAQTALETTLTREEIDAQAEALRFIHSAYIADMEGVDGRYSKLWERITSNAYELKNNEDDNAIVQFSPSSCEEIYDGWESKQPFAINVNYLGSYANLSKSSVTDDAIATTIPTLDGGKLKEAMTYPHLVYGNESSTSLVADTSKTLNSAQGIYIVAVKDTGTSIVTEDGRNASNVPAFYDFYIRTCWYGIGDNTPSTISTVIRLYDPSNIVINIPKSEPTPEPTPEPEPGPKYNLIIQDDNRDYGITSVSSVNVKVGSTSGSTINCPLTDSSRGFYTCSNLTPGTYYYLYPTLVSGYNFDGWVNINANGQLGSTDTMDTHFIMGSADAMLLLMSRQ